MALVLTESSSKISGRIGDVVYVRYKGGIYIRKAAKKRRDANDPKMVLNQQRFARITRFCAAFKHTLIPMIWNDAATKGSGYNFFMKSNTPAFAKDGSVTDPLLLKFSVGELPLPVGLTAQRTAPGLNTIRVSWQKDSHIQGLRLNDEMMAISFDGMNLSAMTATGLNRKQLQGAFNLPGQPVNATHVYLFFMAENHRSFSDSVGFNIG